MDAAAKSGALRQSMQHFRNSRGEGGPIETVRLLIAKRSIIRESNLWNRRHEAFEKDR